MKFAGDFAKLLSDQDWSVLSKSIGDRIESECQRGPVAPEVVHQIIVEEVSAAFPPEHLNLVIRSTEIELGTRPDGQMSLSVQLTDEARQALSPSCPKYMGVSVYGRTAPIPTLPDGDFAAYAALNPDTHIIYDGETGEILWTSTMTGEQPQNVP